MRESFGRFFVSSPRADRTLFVLLGAVWLWKAAEIVGRESRILRRNLGWGYLVDLTVPVVFTGALGLFFLLRRVARR